MSTTTTCEAASTASVPGGKLSTVCLRSIAAHNRAGRRERLFSGTPSVSAGWVAHYDVRIAGRRFTLWAKESRLGSSCSDFVIEIDGRVRFADISPIFAGALSAWEILTGITYLRRYENGSGVYGHHLPVEVLSDRCGPLFNYHPGQITRLKAPVALPPLSAPGYLCDTVQEDAEADSLIGKEFYFVARDAVFNGRFRSGIMFGTVTSSRDGKAVIRFSCQYSHLGKEPLVVERLREPRHLYRTVCAETVAS